MDMASMQGMSSETSVLVGEVQMKELRHHGGFGVHSSRIASCMDMGVEKKGADRYETWQA